jgi:hypothetical protein
MARAPKALWRFAVGVAASPGKFVIASLVITTAGLGLDVVATVPQQALLGLAAWGILAIALVPATHAERAQTLVVVGVATLAEVFGSILVGVYEYRHGNLPIFVPAGHGIVYLTGLRLSQTTWPRGNPRAFTAIAAGGALAWALAGLGLLPRLDVAGAVGVATLLAFLVFSRFRAIYAGVFIAVAYLEIYGTAIGTWRWAEEIPGLGIPDGNPPSGAAAGYVLFDIAALWLAPHLLGAWAGLRTSPPDGRASPPDSRDLGDEVPEA